MWQHGRVITLSQYGDITTYGNQLSMHTAVTYITCHVFMLAGGCPQCWYCIEHPEEHSHNAPVELMYRHWQDDAIWVLLAMSAFPLSGLNSAVH